jgi:imidazole glycerol phosphate synthase subunit HisF
VFDKYKTASGNVKVSVELTDEQIATIARFNEKTVDELTIEDITATIEMLVDRF